MRSESCDGPLGFSNQSLDVRILVKGDGLDDVGKGQTGLVAVLEHGVVCQHAVRIGGADVLRLGADSAGCDRVLVSLGLESSLAGRCVAGVGSQEQDKQGEAHKCN